MKSNRPLWSNMSWRTHKCLRTCWGNVHSRRHSRLTYRSSHCAKHRANAPLNCTSPAHKSAEETLQAKWASPSFSSSLHHTHTHTHWQSDPPSTPPVIQLVCPRALPALWWWTASGKTNLPLQPFPPQLPGNIIKRGSLSGPRARCLAPTPLRLSSAATLQSCFHNWFIPLSGWLLHHPLLSSCRREIHTDDWRGAGPRAEYDDLFSKMEFLLHLVGGCEITDVCQELS